MNKLIAAAVLALCIAAPALAQQPAPAAQPGVASKAAEAAGGMAQKMLGTATAPAPKVQLVNINRATADELDALPQIGKARSEAIIKARPYKSADELVTKKVLSQGVYDTIKDRISVR